jgi:hypothetical protein
MGGNKAFASGGMMAAARLRSRIRVHVEAEGDHRSGATAAQRADDPGEPVPQLFRCRPVRTGLDRAAEEEIKGILRWHPHSGILDDDVGAEPHGPSQAGENLHDLAGRPHFAPPRLGEAMKLTPDCNQLLGQG